MRVESFVPIYMEPSEKISYNFRTERKIVRKLYHTDLSCGTSTWSSSSGTDMHNESFHNFIETSTNILLFPNNLEYWYENNAARAYFTKQCCVRDPENKLRLARDLLHPELQGMGFEDEGLEFFLGPTVLGWGFFKKESRLKTIAWCTIKTRGASTDCN